MKILYIDDDADDREMMDLALRAANPAVQVAFAENGLEGIDLLEKAKIDNDLPCLVVLDINMPVMDGRKTLEVIRKDPALTNLPVVIFTSSRNAHDEAFFSTKAKELITKPFSSSKLAEIAHRMLAYCTSLAT
jgi:CheY-like chemotaxis protein